VKNILLFVFLLASSSQLFAQETFFFHTTNHGVFRDGNAFFIKGQSWAKKTDFTYKKEINAEQEVEQKLTELHNIGVNLIRIYGSPDESDWSGSSNYANLINWIEEWNISHPDNGDPNKAMYYMVQISPKDPLSTLNGNMPENNLESFNRSINDISNPASVASLVKKINELTQGSRFLLAYLIYHEFNVSSKYNEWMQSIGAEGIELFMNTVADSIHNFYAPGKLVTHTGDAKEPENDIYKSIENLDQLKGNVFARFDMLGFNLYISNNSLLEQNSYYDRIVNRRSLSVNENRGWYIGETGASYDKEADPDNVASANYTNAQGAANLELMWHKSKSLGNLLGFMLFTVQDNDLLELENLNAMKQRGFFDFYGDKKFLYYIFSDVINEMSTNNRSHSNDDYSLKLSVDDEELNYAIRFQFMNKSTLEKQFAFSIYSDDGGITNQRFSIELLKEFVILQAGEETEFLKLVEKPINNKLLAVEASIIQEINPVNQYYWGREYLLEDAISTIAGLNLNTTNLPENPLITSSTLIDESQYLIKALHFVKNNQILSAPEGVWEFDLYNINGVLLYKHRFKSFEVFEIDRYLTEVKQSLAIYTLRRLQ